ncbi:Transposase [hydrothermal vent metagenome]|uniref:Transposase n=1 Tax=hydrothermal vent metagenome TaxID=652676 RepID=A0A1W1C2D3_9ZZZZ
MAILCDFKDRDEKDVITYIITRLRELTEDNSHKLGKYLLTLEELSTNRNLYNIIKEVESMLKDMKFEDLPSYEIGMERGISQGISQGLSQGIIQTAITMI